MNIRYRVTLSSEERGQLLALVNGGRIAVRRVKRAQILLAAAAGSSDERIATSGLLTASRRRPRALHQARKRRAARW